MDLLVVVDGVTDYGAWRKVFNEDEYKGDNAIYIGKTNFAKTAEVDSDLLDEDAYFFKQVVTFVYPTT